MDEQNYERLKRQFGSWASWAVWHPNCHHNLDYIEAKVKKLHSGYVFVGHNPSKDLRKMPHWTNYHYPSNTGKEKLLRETFAGSPYEYSYMTDIFSDQYGSPNVVTKTSGKLDQAFKRLVMELKTLEAIAPIKRVFIFGRETFELWEGRLELWHYPVKRLYHFADRNGRFRQSYGPLWHSTMK